MAKIYGKRWEIVKALPEGGQAHIFLVIDKKGDGATHYVLKRLKNLKRIRRFKREIEAVQNLDHEHIVKFVDFNLETDKPYLVTEYCLGGSLNQAKKFWRESPLIALELFRQICEGVRYAHSKDIIHRDLKPDNIYLRSEKGPAVVGDFGICYVEEEGSRITLTEEAVGPRLFMVPELEDGRIHDISPKSDTYSLGKVLYWLLSGGKIFSREKHRDPKWDLKGKNEDSWLGWNNIYMEHVNRLLDFMIVSDPEARIGVNNILILLKRVKRLVQEEFNPIDKDIPQPCYYCGIGIYVLKANSDNVQNFGINLVGSSDWRIFVCSECGHVQAFQVDLANKKEWWAGY